MVIKIREKKNHLSYPLESKEDYVQCYFGGRENEEKALKDFGVIAVYRHVSSV